MCGKHVHYKPSIKYFLLKMLCEEKVTPCLVRLIVSVLWEMEYKTRQHSAENYHDQTMKFTLLAVVLNPCNPWVCLHHTYGVCKSILRCLTRSHMTILSKSKYCVRLNVKIMLLTQSHFISIFGKAITLVNS